MIRHTAKFIFQIVFYAALAAVVIYIMGNGLGLVNGLDFGAGAYYYADIQDWKRAKYWLKRAKKNGYKDKELQKRIRRNL